MKLFCLALTLSLTPALLPATLVAAAPINQSGITFRLSTVEEKPDQWPIFKVADSRFSLDGSHDQGVSPTQNFAFDYKKSILETLKKIQVEHGSVVVDCGVFTQIAALLLGGVDKKRFFLIPPVYASIKLSFLIIFIFEISIFRFKSSVAIAGSF